MKITLMKGRLRYKNERKEVARFMRRLYRQGLTTTSGGNISKRLTDDVILITPSATDKGKMKWKEVGIVSIKGRNLTPGIKLSIESALHLGIYKKNPDVSAVIHAHPVFASSFTAMDTEINTCLTAEARVICGKPMFVPYKLMGTPELAACVADNSVLADVLLLENHGIITFGNSLLNAFGKLEVLENAAKMTLITKMTGNIREMSSSQVQEIDRLYGHRKKITQT